MKQDDVELKLKKCDADSNGEDVVVVTKTVEEPSNYCPGILKLTFNKYLSSAKAFYRQLVDRRSRKTADVYTFIFMCDFVNFFVILFGFSSFGVSLKIFVNFLHLFLNFRSLEVMPVFCRILRRTKCPFCSCSC